MNKKLIAAVVAGATILAISQTASAGVSVGVAVGAPAPVYAAPAYGPTYVGWHDDRRWEARRWHEHQWRERHWDDHRWGGDRRWGDRHDDYGYRRW
ncbi:MAG TPA: hypothetical protein VG320_05210 [Paraburkholderia sp.]|jgi:hypothetical protein|uniref:hypothetical protein n=1 Tax=Paraburkholderia sp. TaxID=1926495 RepID=UPI002DF2926B|nr:hypothetical protein [Paraburkholderia sp.]